MCTKVSGFAVLVQARTCGWGQRCNFWRQKSAGQRVHQRQPCKEKCQSGFEQGKGLFAFLFLNKMEILWHHHQAAGDSVRLTYSQEPLTPPPAANLSGTALIFRLHREKDCLMATPYCYRADSLRNHARTPDGSVGTAALKHYSSANSKRWKWCVCSPQQR